MSLNLGSLSVRLTFFLAVMMATTTVARAAPANLISPDQLTFLAQDPFAARQPPPPTSQGQTLWTLQPYNGEIYVGYGDWIQNTGPIVIDAFNPVSRSFDDAGFTSYTQAIENYRTLNGNLFAPSIDGHKFNVPSDTPTDYAMGLPWSAYAPETPWHTFDMASYTGTDLWFVGSDGSGTAATAYQTCSNPSGWCQVQSFPGTDSPKYYFIGNFNGDIYLQAAPGEDCSQVYNGTFWSTGPNLLYHLGTSTGFRPVVVDNVMVYYDQELAHGNTGIDVFTRDNTLYQLGLLDNAPIVGFTTDGSELYAVTPDGYVYQSADLVTWTADGGGGLAQSESAQSIAVLNGVAYVGTTKSNIYDLSLSSHSGSHPRSFTMPWKGPGRQPTACSMPVGAREVGLPRSKTT